MWRHWQLLLCVVSLLHHMRWLMAACPTISYDVIDSSEITGLLRKYFDSPGRFCTTGHFAMFRALYLRLTGSVYVPVKNVVFLMLRTLTRLSILNQWSFPLSLQAWWFSYLLSFLGMKHQWLGRMTPNKGGFSMKRGLPKKACIQFYTAQQKKMNNVCLDFWQDSSTTSYKQKNNSCT